MNRTIAFCCRHEPFNKNNFIFENLNTAIGDNLFLPLHILKQYALEKDLVVCTVDNVDIKDSMAVVFSDMPTPGNRHYQYAKKLKKPMYLLAFESEMVLKDNYRKCNEQIFEKIFTFRDDLVDNKKYFKINYSYVFPKFRRTSFTKRKLCTLIAGNKTANYPLELYSERVNAIRWFEQNHPDDFDLYGIGWDLYRFGGCKIVRALNRVPALTKLLATPFPSYKGRIDRKKEVLEQYKFAICYENARDIPGYITEKIFDCFFAGCIPVYWGANNIEQHIPKECFIDKRDFDDYEKLYAFLTNVSQERYALYNQHIDDFLHSTQAVQFSAAYFAKTLLKEIVGE